jgi:uncharacterized protein (DUF2249 family)
MSGETPGATARVPDPREVHLDVRPNLERGEEPLGRILAAAKHLGEGEVLVLHVSFEPLPLYRVLGRLGFAHRAERRAAKDWVVRFQRAPAGKPGAAAAQAPGAPTGHGAGTGVAAAEPADETAAAATVRLDVRNLEPPEPMVRVLLALDTLAADATLEVLHDRRPVFLYPQLEERGFRHETREIEPGLVRILIRRAAGPAGGP